MEANLAATSALLLSHGFRAHFPILEANKAADTIIFLLETEREPNLAVISLLLSAAKDAVTESTGTSRTGCAKKVKRNEDFAPIQWEALHELWKTFRNVLTADSENFKRWRRKRTGSDSSTESTVSSAEADVVKIYRFITRAVTVSENSSAAPRGGLVKFINAAADTADRKFKDTRRYDLDLSDIKQVALIIAQLLGMKDVHLSLSETRVFLGIGGSDKNGGGLVGIPDFENGFLPRGAVTRARDDDEGDGLPAVKDLWICSKGEFVHCDRYSEVAYLCCSMQTCGKENSENPLGSLQRIILSHLYRNSKLNSYPMGVAFYGTLESHRGNNTIAENLLRRAIFISQQEYDNAFVFPYSFYLEYLLRTEDYLAALVPAQLASKTASQYMFISSLDALLCNELFTIARNHLCLIVEKTACTKHPSIAALVLSFMDDLCLWEERSKAPILHSLWTQALVTGCLSKLASGSLHRLVIHASSFSFSSNPEAHSQPFSLSVYMDEMLANIRSTSKMTSANSVFCDGFRFPEGLVVDEDFCHLALQLYVRWPPLRANNPRFIDRSRVLLKVPDTRIEDPVAYDSMIELFRSWPPAPMISDADLKRIQPLREINALYKECSGYVFPFLDMGPKNVAIMCFDTERIAREIMVPQMGSPENRIIAALRERLVEIEASTKTAPKMVENRLYAEVLLRSRKMQNIRKMLTDDKFSPAEIRLGLEGYENVEKRNRRQTSRFDV